MSALGLIVSLATTWGIGLGLPALVRFAIYRRALGKYEAIGWILGLAVINLAIFLALGSESKTHAVLYMIGLASYPILTRAGRAKVAELPKVPAATKVGEASLPDQGVPAEARKRRLDSRFQRIAFLPLIPSLLVMGFVALSDPPIRDRNWEVPRDPVCAAQVRAESRAKEAERANDPDYRPSEWDEYVLQGLVKEKCGVVTMTASELAPSMLWDQQEFRWATSIAGLSLLLSVFYAATVGQLVNWVKG